MVLLLPGAVLPDSLLAQSPIDSSLSWRGLFPHPVQRRPRVALVLSGGGARSISQIGVLKALKRHNIPVDFIAATSLGAVVGGLYASGYTPAEIESLALSTNWDEVLSLSDEIRRRDQFLDQKIVDDKSFLAVRFEGLEPVIPSAVSSGQRLTDFLNTIVLQSLYHPNPTFDELKIRFRAVATDLISGRRIVLDRGSLAEALRASATVPLLFEPVERDSFHLIDGGIVTNIPVDIAKAEGYDIVIAVNSTSGLRNRDEINAPWETADQIMGIMMQAGNERQLADADIVITPDIRRHLASDFTGLDSMIARGEEATELVVQSIRSLYEKKKALLGRTPTQDEQVQLVVKPSEVNIIRDVKLSGCSVLSADSLRGLLTQLSSQPLDPLKVEASLEDVLRAYRARGYSLARMETTTFDSSTGMLSIGIDEGVIRRLDVQGGVRTQDYFLFQEFPLVVGDIFEIHKANTGIVNIASTKLFDYVYLETSYPDDQLLVTIRLRERPSQLVRLGVRVDNERNLQGLIDIRDENFRGSGGQLSFTASGGGRNVDLNLEYKAYRLFSTYLTFGVSAYYTSFDSYVYSDVPGLGPDRFERQQVGEYSDIRLGGRLVLGKQLERLGAISAEFSVEDSRINNLQNVPQLEDRFLMTLLKIGTSVDTKDLYPFPTSGTGFSISYEISSQSLGSDIGYNALRGMFESFSTWGESHTLHPRITLGIADKTMPLGQQFRFGGREVLFGLREDDRRGRQLILFNLEYRYRLPVNILFETYLRLRYDLGSISEQPEDFKLSTFKHGLGAEIAFDTPVGPAIFTVGKSFFFVRDLPENPIQQGPLLLYFMLGYPLGSIAP